MAWIILVIAGVFEVVWASAMKHSDAFTRFWPSVVTIGAMLASFGLLAWAMRALPLGTVDASVVAAAERLDVTEVATTDRRHFGVVMPRHAAGFQLLP